MNMPTRDNPEFSDDDIVALAREVEQHDFDRIAPPPLVWNNIVAELEDEFPPQELSARRQSRGVFSSTRILSIAAATLLMVGVVVAVVNPFGSDTPVTEVAAAMMTDDGLPVSTDETANATFICEQDQQCFVQLDLSALPDAGADNLELWVINSDVSNMYSLGNITSNGRFDLPPGVTADEFPIVDISIEPNDGDATHSGQSVLRGVFDQP